MSRILPGKFGKAASETNLFTQSEQSSIAVLLQKGQDKGVLTRMDCLVQPGQTLYKLFGEYEEVPFPLATIGKNNDPQTGETSFTVSMWMLDVHGDPDARSIRHLDNFNAVYHYLDGMIGLNFGAGVEHYHIDENEQDLRSSVVSISDRKPRGPSNIQ